MQARGDGRARTPRGADRLGLGREADGLPQHERDLLEVAALLHDVGVIGVPDHVLFKPGALDSDEAARDGAARGMGLEILRRSCTAPEILTIIEHIRRLVRRHPRRRALQGADSPWARG